MMKFDEEKFNSLLSCFFDFREKHPYDVQTWSVHSSNAIECKKILDQIADLIVSIVDEYRLLGDSTFEVQVSKGYGNFPRNPWVAILYDDEVVSTGVYPLIGFKESSFCYVGCVHSFSNQAISDWDKYRDLKRCPSDGMRAELVANGLANDKNLAMPAVIFHRGQYVEESALVSAIKEAITIRAEVRAEARNSSIMVDAGDGSYSIDIAKLNSLNKRIFDLDKLISRVEEKQSEVLAKSGASVTEVDRLRTELNSVKQSVKDARDEMSASVERAIKKAQEDTALFIQKNEVRLSESLDKLAELKTAYTVDSLAKQLEEKRKAEEDSLKKKSWWFYGSLACFSVIGLIAVGLSLNAITDEMKKAYGWLAYLIPMPKNLVRVAPFSLPLIWFTCHLAKLVAQSRRLMEEYAHKVVVAKTYMGIVNEVDVMFEKHIADAAQLRSELMRTLISTIGNNPNISLDKIKNTTPLSEVADCVARLARSVRDVKPSGN